jgi:hypothetical protein
MKKWKFFKDIWCFISEKVLLTKEDEWINHKYHKKECHKDKWRQMKTNENKWKQMKTN